MSSIIKMKIHNKQIYVVTCIEICKRGDLLYTWNHEPMNNNKKKTSSPQRFYCWFQIKCNTLLYILLRMLILCRYELFWSEQIFSFCFTRRVNLKIRHKSQICICRIINSNDARFAFPFLLYSTDLPRYPSVHDVSILSTS